MIWLYVHVENKQAYYSQTGIIVVRVYLILQLYEYEHGAKYEHYEAYDEQHGILHGVLHEL